MISGDEAYDGALMLYFIAKFAKSSFASFSANLPRLGNKILDIIV